MKYSFTIYLIGFSISVFSQGFISAGNGVNGRVSCFAVYNGELYVGGQFSNPDGVDPIGVLKWNGSDFDTLSGTYLMGSARVEDMAVYNGELYLGGGFCTNCSPDFSIFNNIVKWNGTNFSALGNGCDNVVYSLKTYNGNLYVGGDFDQAGGINSMGIAKWNGSQWISVAGGIPGTTRVFELCEFQNELYAAGSFNFSALNSMCIARWNDTIWSSCGNGGINGVVYSLGTFNNKLFAGGPYFNLAGGVSVNDIASWDGISWNAEGSGIGFNSHIFSLKEFNGKLWVGGKYCMIDGNNFKSLSEYDGLIWNSIEGGVDSACVITDSIISMFDTTFLYAPYSVNAMIEFNGEIFVGGQFNMIGGVAAKNIARWNQFASVLLPVNHDFLIYPNPVQTTLFIEGNEKIRKYEIISLDGKLVSQGTIGVDGNFIQVDFLPIGMYFLKIPDIGINQIFVKMD